MYTTGSSSAEILTLSMLFFLSLFANSSDSFDFERIMSPQIIKHKRDNAKKGAATSNPAKGALPNGNSKVVLPTFVAR